MFQSKNTKLSNRALFKSLSRSLKYFLLLFLAVLITGGRDLNSAELYLPTLGSSCTIPSLPEVRYQHTVDNDILCGGTLTSDSCLQWSPSSGSWEELLTLDKVRSNHVSWTPNSGIGTYLIGGNNEERTTTLIKPDRTQETGFTLEYETR